MEDIELIIQDIPEQREQQDCTALYRAIRHLDPDLKTIIQLRYFNGLKIEAIAKITDTNLSTTKSRLYKALTLLKGELEAGYEEETTLTASAG